MKVASAVIPAVVSAVLCGTPQGVIQDVEVVDLRAHLFCDRTAEFTEDVIGEDPPVLWNTIIGEGGAGCASSSTFVLVILQGPTDKYLGDTTVEFLARVADEESTALVERATRLGTSRPDGFSFLPFWIYDTGCTPIDLYAWVQGNRTETERHERINFMCGE